MTSSKIREALRKAWTLIESGADCNHPVLREIEASLAEMNNCKTCGGSGCVSPCPSCAEPPTDGNDGCLEIIGEGNSRSHCGKESAPGEVRCAEHLDPSPIDTVREALKAGLRTCNTNEFERMYRAALKALGEVEREMVEEVAMRTEAEKRCLGYEAQRDELKAEVERLRAAPNPDAEKLAGEMEAYSRKPDGPLWAAVLDWAARVRKLGEVRP